MSSKSCPIWRWFEDAFALEYQQGRRIMSVVVVGLFVFLFACLFAMLLF